MDKAKIRLSPLEADLVTNASWILTKNAIIQKVKHILEGLQSAQQLFFQGKPGLLPAEIMAIPPKISKGENYEGLPYLVLDYPRFFDKDDHFAIRCMFWWGHFFSITLHLSGIYKTMYQARIGISYPFLRQEGLHVSVSDDPWQHHFEASNYRPLSEMQEDEFRQQVINRAYVKLAKKIPLEQWDDAYDLLSVSFVKLMEWLED